MLARLPKPGLVSNRKVRPRIGAFSRTMSAAGGETRYEASRYWVNTGLEYNRNLACCCFRRLSLWKPASRSYHPDSPANQIGR
jgi:transposase